MQQKVEDIRRAGRPERPAQVTAKKETALSPEFTVSKHEDHRQIITRRRQKGKREFYIKIAIIAAVLLVFAIIVCAIIIPKETTTAETPTRQQEEESPTPEPATEAPKTYGYFAYLTDDGEPQLIDMAGLAKAWAAEAGFEVRYPLTDAERYELAQIITAEAEASRWPVKWQFVNACYKQPRTTRSAPLRPPCATTTPPDDRNRRRRH